jgi:gamma-tubulin complex component 3
MAIVVRDNPNPTKALKFSNLFSKLVTQPVLNQKWAMLYFLYQLSDPSVSPHSLPPANITHNTGAEERTQNPSTPHKGRGERQFSVDSPSFNEAFSNAGLRRLPANDGSPQPSPRAPVHHEKAERRREKSAVDTIKEIPTEESPQPEQTYPPITPTEPALLRDLPFTLQGLSSTNLLFSHHGAASLKLPTTLPVPLISLLHTLAEPSLLYRGLSQFVESTEGGLVGQSFRSALSKELRSYLGLVATLEGQIRQALAMLDDTQPRQGIGKAGVTLKRCVIWTREPTMGLRLMSLMVEESKSMFFHAPL